MQIMANTETPKKSTEKLYRYLIKNHPEDILMPVNAKTKAPLNKHTNNQWSWAKFRKAINQTLRESSDINVGILVKSLLVIDIDDESLVDDWELKYPVLKQVPMEKTRKGRHYFFARTAYCDDLGLFDKADAFADPVSKEPISKVDLKTVASTGTGGLVVVSPSKNKSWIRPIWEAPLLSVPKDMAESLADMYQARKANNGIKKKKAGRPAKNAIVPITDKLIKNTIDLLDQHGFINIIMISMTEDGFNFDAQRSDEGVRCECPNCSHLHENNMWWAIVSGPPGNQRVTVKSYSGRCRVKVIPMCSDMHEFYKSTYPDRFELETYDSPRVKPYPIIDHRVIADQATYGAGKTRASIKFCKDYAEYLGKNLSDVRILAVTSRRAYAFSQQKEFAKHGLLFDLYIDEVAAHNNLENSSKLFLEMESLWRYKNIEVPDILLVDESEACVDIFSSKTMMENAPKLCSDVFSNLVNNCSKVLWLDAKITNRGLGCLDRILLSQEKVVFRQNQAIINRRRLYMIKEKSVDESEKKLIEIIISLLKNGKRVVSPVGTKAFGDRLIARVLEEIPNLQNFKYYHGQMEDKDKEELKDVHKNWSNMALLIYTALITVGISYDIEDQFDIMVVHGSVYGPKPRDLVQMMHRVRCLKEKEVYCTLDTALRGKRYATSWSEINADKQMMLDLQRAYLSDPDKLDKLPEWYACSHKMNEWERRLSQQYFKNIFYDYIKLSGYQVEKYDEVAFVYKCKKCTGTEMLDDCLSCLTLLFAQQDPIKTNNDNYLEKSFTLYDDIPTVNLQRYNQIRSSINAGKASSIEKEIAMKYEYDRDIVINHDAEDIIAKVFDETRHHRCLRQILLNKHDEICQTEKRIYQDNMVRSTYSELSSKRAETLLLIKRLCNTLGLQNTHDVTTLIAQKTFEDNLVTLQNDVEHLFSLVGLRDLTNDTQSKESQQPYIKLAKTISRIFKEYGGFGLDSKERAVKIKGKKVRLYNYQIDGSKNEIVWDMIRLMT